MNPAAAVRSALLLGGMLASAAFATVAAPVLKWQHGGCYSSWCETGWYSSPAVADLYGDGTPEVVAAAYSIVVLDGATGALLALPRVTIVPSRARAWGGRGRHRGRGPRRRRRVGDRHRPRRRLGLRLRCGGVLRARLAAAAGPERAAGARGRRSRWRRHARGRGRCRARERHQHLGLRARRPPPPRLAAGGRLRRLRLGDLQRHAGARRPRRGWRPGGDLPLGRALHLRLRRPRQPPARGPDLRGQELGTGRRLGELRRRTARLGAVQRRPRRELPHELRGRSGDGRRSRRRRACRRCRQRPHLRLHRRRDDEVPGVYVFQRSRPGHRPPRLARVRSTSDSPLTRLHQIESAHYDPVVADLDGDGELEIPSPTSPGESMPSGSTAPSTAAGRTRSTALRRGTTGSPPSRWSWISTATVRRRCW